MPHVWHILAPNLHARNNNNSTPLQINGYEKALN